VTRIEIINHLIQKYGYNNYLEIGVRVKADCFDQIQCEDKTSVDPGYENDYETYDYKMESDVFFQSLNSGQTKFDPNHKWDIIFIDGLHISYQVHRDVLNSLEHLAEGGTIVMHDCSPPNEDSAMETFNGGLWCGTVWKTFVWFRTHRPDLWMACVNDDYGVGIIRVERGGQLPAPNDNPLFEFGLFNYKRKEYLNLIEPSEFLELFEL
jgi:hypothetical protein